MSILFKFVLLLIFLYKVNGQSTNIQSRVFPSCSLISTTIYCFGGFTQINSSLSNNKNITNYGQDFDNPINENIALNLSQFNNFTTFDINKIVWEKKSPNLENSPLEGIGYGASTSINEDNSYLVYGGQVNDAMTPLSHPFINYNPQTDTWKSLPLPNGNNYTDGATIVNLGNDTIWVWGGTINNSQANVSDVVNIYDYKKNMWINQIITNGNIRVGHTATLASNGNIYIMGGIFKAANQVNFYPVGFDKLRNYNTNTLQWVYINSTGDTPSSRVAHTVTQILDPNLLLVYGGIAPSGLNAITDTCYIYNIASNTFKYVSLTSDSFSINRFGHYATTFSSNFLILLFGFTNTNTAADHISILNINDPYHPVWFTAPTTPPANNENGSNNGLSTEKLIPIVVCVCVVVLVIVGALIFYIRRRKNKQKKAFVLEQQDPRKGVDKHDFFELNTQDSSTVYNTNNVKPSYTEGSTTIVESQNNNKPIQLKKMNDKEHLYQQSKANIVKPFGSDDIPIKPYSST